MNLNYPDQVAILFADVSGSTQMYEKLGDTLAHDCVSASLKRIIHHIEAHGGRVIETIGDEVMSAFVSIDGAAHAAIEMQKHFFSHPIKKNYFVNIRVGFHFGPIEYDHGHPFGDTVNVAARVVALCEPGRIIATSTTLKNAREREKLIVRPYQRAKVKGKSQPLLVEEIVWDGEDATSLFNATSLTQTTQVMNLGSVLILRHLGREIKLTTSNTPFVFGRSPRCDLVIDSALASRNHGRIEFRWGDIVLVDHSTNGSYIENPQGLRESDGLSKRLHRRELPLRGKGVIGIGAQVALSDPMCILEYESIQP